jgi:hypothetical protein
MEFALGLPRKSVISEIPVVSKYPAEFVVQEHNADVAGKHFDLRLGINGIGYSWAGKYLPGPGEKVLMTRQPDHTIPYFDFSGTIEKGYGKGTVTAFLRDKVEIMESSPSKITFYLYPGSSVVKYTLVNTGGLQWILLNHTTSKEIRDRLDSIKPLKYADQSSNYLTRPGDIPTPKIDGASSYTILRPNKSPLVFSRRISKRNELPIEYTPKIEGVYTKKSPSSLGTTILRTEVYSVTPDNREVPNRILGGMLNSNVWKSREFQKTNMTPLQLAAYDIVRFKGRDVSGLPYDQKLELINRVKEVFPYINTPSSIDTSFTEGKVVWRDGVPIKVKNKQDYDVYVKNIFKANTSSSKPRAGGIEYSLTPDGSAVGRVGTGFTHPELTDMLNSPQNYLGRVAKVYALEQHPSGALRAPSFNTWHLDK